MLTRRSYVTQVKHKTQVTRVKRTVLTLNTDCVDWRQTTRARVKRTHMRRKILVASWSLRLISLPTRFLLCCSDFKTDAFTLRLWSEVYLPTFSMNSFCSSPVKVLINKVLDGKSLHLRTTADHKGFWLWSLVWNYRPDLYKHFNCRREQKNVPSLNNKVI